METQQQWESQSLQDRRACECSTVVQNVQKVFSINLLPAPICSLHTGLNAAGSRGGFGGPQQDPFPCTHTSEEILYLKTFSFIPVKENFHTP